MARLLTDSPVTASLVEQRLAEAGRVLLALPHAGCFPMGFGSMWMDAVMASEAAEWLPSPAEISAMDEAYRWVRFVPDETERRLVLMRSLVRRGQDGKPRHVWTWRKLRKMTGLHHDTLTTLWGRGIDRIARGLNGRDRRLPSGALVMAGRYSGASRLRGAAYSGRVVSAGGPGGGFGARV